MNVQEIFDIVFTKLYEQGSQSINPEYPHECMYRGPDGMKCAAGFLIPDELYRTEMENISIGGWVSGDKYFCEFFGLPDYINENIKMIEYMQDAHDAYDSGGEITFRGYIADQFRVIAKEYDLNTDVIDRLPI